MQDTDEIMMELSAGVGGQEAMLFTSDLFNMYSRYLQNRGLSVKVVEVSNAEAGSQCKHDEKRKRM